MQKNIPKAVFSYAKKKMKMKTGIADLRKTGGVIASSSKKKADVLNEFFSSVFIKDKSSIHDFKKTSYNKPRLDLIITPEQVLNKVKELNSNKATGPDNIPSRLLKELSDVLCDPILRVMKKSIQEQYIPINWKKAHVVPIFKKGKKTLPGNYRPVSLTSITCKLEEGLVREKLIDHLSSNKRISESQHGFISGRSCSANLNTVL